MLQYGWIKSDSVNVNCLLFVDYQGRRGTCRPERSSKAFQHPWGLRCWRGSYASSEDWTLAAIATLLKTQLITLPKWDVKHKLCHVANIFIFGICIYRASFVVCFFFLFRRNNFLIFLLPPNLCDCISAFPQQAENIICELLFPSLFHQSSLLWEKLQ